MFTELRRAFWSGNFDSVEVRADDLTAARVRDIEAVFTESVCRIKTNADDLPRYLRAEKLGLPSTKSAIPFPTPKHYAEEISWALKSYDYFPLAHPRYRISADWRPAGDRADFQKLLCAFVETGDRWKLAPIIYSTALSRPDNRILFADALRCRLDISADQVRRLLDAHASGAARKTFDVIDGLQNRKRLNADGSPARGGRRKHAICLGPTRSEYRDYARTLSRKTGIPVQDIEKAAKAIGALRA